MVTTTYQDNDMIGFLRSLTVKERESLGHRVGTTGAYIVSLIYKQGKSRNLPLLAEIHRMTNGRVDMTYMMEDSYGMKLDWITLRDILLDKFPPNKYLSHEAIAQAKEEMSKADASAELVD